MKIIAACCLMFSTFTISSFSQTAKKINEFSVLPCGHFMAYMDNMYQGEIKDNPQNKIYVIYYEGKNDPLMFMIKKLRDT